MCRQHVARGLRRGLLRAMWNIECLWSHGHMRRVTRLVVSARHGEALAWWCVVWGRAGRLHARLGKRARTGLNSPPPLSISLSLSSSFQLLLMMFTPERHLPTPGQHSAGTAPSGTPPPAQPPPPPQTRRTQSHSAPTLVKRAMLAPEGSHRPEVSA